MFDRIVSMKLKSIIDARGGVPGTTAPGKAWALKALHPADPVVEVTGIPDEDAYPTVFQHWQFTFNVSNPTPATAGTWEFDLFFHPNPIVPCGLRTKDSNGNYLWSPIANDQIGAAGSSIPAKTQTFASTVERYRIAYAGLTGHLDAAAVTDQGMLAGVQYPLGPLSLSYTTSAFNQFSILTDAYSELPKTWAQMQTMPNAYLGTSREGIYAVYKLSETCQDWVSARDHKLLLPYGNASSLQASTPIVGLAAAPNLSHITNGFPYGLSGYYSGCTPAEAIVLRRADDGCMHIAGRNLHQTSQLTFMLRLGYELQVSAGSPWTSFQRVSPMHDPVALTGYYAIARELKDAYPEEYNNLGMLLGVIAKAAASALPIVLPALGSAWREGKALWNGKGNQKLKKAERQAENASATVKENTTKAAMAKLASPNRTGANVAGSSVGGKRRRGGRKASLAGK